MLRVGMLVIYGFLTMLMLFYASAVVVTIVNIVAGAAMDTAFSHDQHRPDAKMD